MNLVNCFFCSPIRVSPGARSSAITIGIGMFPSMKSDCKAIEDHLYAGPPSVALISWYDNARPLSKVSLHAASECRLGTDQ